MISIIRNDYLKWLAVLGLAICLTTGCAAPVGDGDTGGDTGMDGGTDGDGNNDGNTDGDGNNDGNGDTDGNNDGTTITANAGEDQDVSAGDVVELSADDSAGVSPPGGDGRDRRGAQRPARQEVVLSGPVPQLSGAVAAPAGDTFCQRYAGV